MLEAFNIDFLIFLKLGFRSCLPLMADRSNTLNSEWQKPSRLQQAGVRFDHYGNSTGVSPCYFNGGGPVVPICGIKSVSPLPIPIDFLP